MLPAVFDEPDLPVSPAVPSVSSLFESLQPTAAVARASALTAEPLSTNLNKAFITFFRF